VNVICKTCSWIDIFVDSETIFQSTNQISGTYFQIMSSSDLKPW